ncbi:MAG: flagellar assembly protein FliW [bacterium]|nr:flagellar assembly protein FliW [bacterium]
MELKGTRFGTLQYEDKDLLHLPEGLVGMPEQTEFLILDFEVDTPLKWLQSIKDSAMGFLVGDPLLFRPDYKLALVKSELQDLNVTSPEDLAVFVICTMQEEFEDITANMLGPIIVHVESRKGRQVIVEGSEFSTHENLYKQSLEATELKSAVCEKVG